TTEGTNFNPFWSPKGDRLGYSSTRGGGTALGYFLYQRDSNGSGPDELLVPASGTDRNAQWTRDGRFLVFNRLDPKNKDDLWVVPMQPGQTASSAKPTPFLQTEFNEFEGQFSPDGHWMAYTSDESGQRE